MADAFIKIGISEQDLLQLDEDKRFEVVDGIIVENGMAAGFNHVLVIDNLYDILKPFAKKHKLGRVHTDSLTFILHTDKENNIQQARIPDLSFIKRGKMPDDFDRSRPFSGAPDLAVEVVSPSESTADIMAKVSDYLRYGTEQVWVIYPLKEELHQYLKDDNAPRIFLANDTLIAETLFPQLKITIADLFADEDF